MKHKCLDGIIEVITGPMFSGKSEELIKRIKLFSYAEIPTLVVKPLIDNRFSENKIVSRSGSSIVSYSVDNLDDIKELFGKKKYQALVIDEAQFFNDNNLIAFLEELSMKGIRIIVCGLDTDFRRKPFPIMADLMTIADSVLKLKAICFSCRNFASCTFRTSSDSQTIVIGDVDKYEARCRICHEKGMKLIHHKK